MLKNKPIAIFVIANFFFLVVGMSVVSAANLAIQSLPSYINTDSFKLSCTSDASSVSFSVSKDGGPSVTFATVDLTSSPCQVQVTSSQISGEGSYVFTVTDGSASSSTSTIYDTSGPSAVSGYYKDGLGDGYRLHYRTPGDSDFDKVIIYRGETPDFSADSSHEIATVNSSPNSDMTYEDHSGVNKYYAIRALDHAGNSSGLVGDGGGVVTVTQTSSPSPVSGKYIILPKETGEGSVLGTEATASPTGAGTPQPEEGLVGQINQFANQTPEPFKWILTHKKVSLGVAAVLLGIAYGLYRMSRKK